MGKFSFFAKQGRPSKNESKLCRRIKELVDTEVVSQEQIEALIELQGTPVNEQDLDKFYSQLTGDTPNAANTAKNPIPQQKEEAPVAEEFPNADELVGEGEYVQQDATETSKPTNKSAIDYDPFAQPVKERAYTQGLSGQPNAEQSETPPEEESYSQGAGVHLEEDDFAQPQGETESVADNVGAGGFDQTEGTNDIPNQEFTEYPEEEVLEEPDFANTQTRTDDEESLYGDVEAEEIDEPKEKLGGDNLEDLTPAQKRKASEKTAEALLDMYCKFAPLPFKQWASFSDKKIHKLVLEDKLNLNMRLENNVTVKQFIDGTNSQVEEIFEVGEDTREAIKDPLIDVLMEQDLALTPTQRLMMAVGTHVVQMGFSAFQLAQQNKLSLDAFVKWRSEEKDRYGDNNNYQTDGPPVSAAKSSISPNYNGSEMTATDKDLVNEIMEELNKDDDGVIDTEHDPNVTVEEVPHED